MEWTPIVFGAFKALVLGVGMYFAVKWHYDQAATKERRAALRMGGMLAAVFLIFLLLVGIITYVLSTMLGLDLNLP